jgi:hypothetical protein
VTLRCLLVLSALLLFAHGANCGAAYQRTKDGQTFIWNNFPRQGDAATWSGRRDANGYATGYGTLTWYKSERKIVTGSNVPSSAVGNLVVGRYTGQMVRGKFEGLVINVDANGQTFHGRFVDGRKTSDWSAGPPPTRSASADQSRIENRNVETEPPAAGPPLDERHAEESSDVAPVNSASSESLAAVTTPSALRAPIVAATVPPASLPPTPAQSSASSVSVEPIVRNRIIADFKEETRSVLSRVADATGNFQEIDRLDSVQELPTPVSESVDALSERARDFRAKLGYETALRECRSETQIADALSIVDQITHNLAASDAAQAATRVRDFLGKNPEAPGESQRNLWHYLASVQSLGARLEKEADAHLQQAQLFVSAGRDADAIREYQEAYRIFPTPATAEKIHQLRENSLGL